MPPPPRKATGDGVPASDAAMANLTEQIGRLAEQIAALGGRKPPNDPEGTDYVADDADDPRRVAHELLGQSHAVFLLALRPDVLGLWCPGELQSAVLGTKAEIVEATGLAQIAVASGDHDRDLMAAGLGGPASRPKRLGLRLALQRLINALKSDATADRLPWLRTATGWAKNALESFPKMLPHAEKIKEALEIVLSGIDTVDAMRRKPQ
jgi:hypothetical protein